MLDYLVGEGRSKLFASVDVEKLDGVLVGEYDDFIVEIESFEDVRA